MLLRVYIDKRWWPAQRLALNTKAQYRSLLIHHILPAFGDRPLVSVTSPEEIAAWEIALHEQPQLPGGRPLSVNSARKCRKLLALILSDAVTADLISRNAARIPRRRGMAASEARAAAEAGQEPWTNALLALLIAERAALLSGRDEEFVQVITMHYTGMRWGEITGLEAANVKPGSIRIWWQLAEVNGVFVKVPPKYGSRRTIDIAPFLQSLISAQLRATEGRECSCDRPGGTPLCEGTRHFFLGRGKDQPGGRSQEASRGVHQRRSGYAAWIFKPAATGWYPQRSPQPARPVPVTAGPFPGIPVRGRNAHGRAQACWVPLLPGATPHSCRHGRETCMDGHGVQKVLRDLVMGHRTAGMEGVYAHVTPESRAALVAADEADWKASLAARAVLSPHSPVAILNDLLVSFRDD